MSSEATPRVSGAFGSALTTAGVGRANGDGGGGASDGPFAPLSGGWEEGTSVTRGGGSATE